MRVEFERSRGKNVLALLGCIGFIAVSVLLVLFGGPSGVVVGVLGAVTFGVFLVLWVRMALRGGGLVVDGEGLDDHSSATAVGRVPWADVVEVSERTDLGSPVVVVTVRNPDSYLARMGRLRRSAARANLGLVGSPVTLASTGLRTDHARLLRTLQQAFLDYQLRHPPVPGRGVGGPR